MYLEMENMCVYGVGILPSASNYVQADDANMPSELNCTRQRKLSNLNSTLPLLLLLLLPFILFPEVFHSLRLSWSRQTPMSWFQKTFTLPPSARGSYLITDHVVKELPEIKSYKVGLLHLFVQHTSCALSMNENWDSDVRTDMSNALDRIAPDAGPKGEELYLHSAEGPDDMPVCDDAALRGSATIAPLS